MPSVGHEAAVAYQHWVAIHLCLSPMAGNVAERRDGQFRDSRLVGTTRNSLSQRML